MYGSTTPNRIISAPRFSIPPPPDPSHLPPTTFPTPAPPPPNLPIRLPPNTPVLDALDEAFTHSSSRILNNNKNDLEDDESISIEAWQALMQHKKDRVPHVLNASQRLQAASGIKNNLPFEIPETPTSVIAKRAALYDVRNGNGLGISGLDAEFKTKGVKRDSYGTALPATVDQVTGKGLREFLLHREKECETKMIQCKSLSFHDITPDMRSNKNYSRLLGHFITEKGSRVDFNEIELPATKTDPATGAYSQSSETWIWFLFSGPMVDNPVTATDKAPTTHHNSHPRKTSTSGRTEDFDLSTGSTSSSSSLPSHDIPSPITTTWLVFALPKAYCTIYPERIEEFSSHSNSHSHNKPQSVAQSQPNIINKRIDFDLSFSGVPVFEFSSKPRSTLTSLSAYIETLILRLPKGGSTKEERRVEEEIERLTDLYRDAVGGKWLSVDTETDKIEWNEALIWDVERWRDIRAAMSRGKMRLVMRWVETTAGSDTADLEMSDFDATKGSAAKMTAGSDSRRRGALGMGGLREVVMSGTLMGVGIPTRTRSAAARATPADTIAEDDGSEAENKENRDVVKKVRGRKR